jgi:drug/metabolite transporter (DMT)-like permease
MFGILLSTLSSASSELSESISKKKVVDGVASYYTFGFLTLLFGTAILIIIGVWRQDFIFSLASLPTFIPRVFLEVLQAHVSILAVVKADRSNYGPIRTLTIPLLLMVDVALGYAITPTQMTGMVIIFLTIFLLLYYERFKAKGLFIVLFTAVNAVATLSLYKYDITHFNSVETEQVLVQLILLLYFFVLAVMVARENPFTFLRKGAFFAQASASGLASSFASYAYVFVPASIATAALRASAVLFSVLSGKLYFKEKHFLIKTLAICGILVGLFLLL